MNYIKLLTENNFKSNQKPEKNKEVGVLLNENHKIISINLYNGEILAKHMANTSISVLCLSGNGTFRAGNNLEEEQKLTQGTLLYLEKTIPHEIVAETELKILVTKFSE